MEENNTDFDTILRLMFDLGYPQSVHDETAFQKWKEKLKENKGFKDSQ